MKIYKIFQQKKKNRYIKSNFSLKTFLSKIKFVMQIIFQTVFKILSF